MLQQVNQQVEYLRLHRNEFTVAPQLAKIGVQSVSVEVKFHERIGSHADKSSA